VTAEERAPKRRTWVGEWIRSEAFWRDVTSRALSGLIVLALGALAAGVLGYLPAAAVLRGVLSVATMGGAMLTFIGSISLLNRWARRAEERRRATRQSVNVVTIWFFVSTILIFVVLVGAFAGLLLLVSQI
jgi:hypothetical protein